MKNQKVTIYKQSLVELRNILTQLESKPFTDESFLNLQRKLQSISSKLQQTQQDTTTKSKVAKINTTNKSQHIKQNRVLSLRKLNEIAWKIASNAHPANKKNNHHKNSVSVNESFAWGWPVDFDN